MFELVHKLSIKRMVSTFLKIYVYTQNLINSHKILGKEKDIAHHCTPNKIHTCILPHACWKSELVWIGLQRPFRTHSYMIFSSIYNKLFLRYHDKNFVLLSFWSSLMTEWSIDKQTHRVLSLGLAIRYWCWYLFLSVLAHP